MKFRLFLWGFVGLSLVGCRKSEEVPVAPQSEKRVSFVRDYDEARTLAERSIALVDGVQATRAARPRTIASGECVVVEGTRASGGVSDTLLYVFNFADDAGFSIIAADASADPLIAVTEKGRYVYGEPTGVEPFDAYMAQTMNDLPLGPDKPLIPDPRPRFYKVEYDTDVTVGPLLRTKWGQGGVYGSYCPNGLSGCTATAMAQILAYHRVPASIQLTAVIGNHWVADRVELDWTDMLRHYGVGNCFCLESATHDRIAVLMREIGYRVGMSYSGYGSGSDNQSINVAFRSLGCIVPDTLRNCLTNEIFGSLQKERPVLACGLKKRTNNGHTWVVDGYVDYKCGVEYYEWTVTEPDITDGEVAFIPEGQYLMTSSTVVERRLLHFNWGWDGNCDGYFSLGVYNPDNAEEYDDENRWNHHGAAYEDQVKFLLNVHK